MTLLAIEKKLNSNQPLENRCVFARNVFFANSQTVKFGQKDSLIIEWAVSILMKKFSQNHQLSADAPLWKLLLEITDSTRFEVNFLAVTPQEKLWDLLTNVVDHSGWASENYVDNIDGYHYIPLFLDTIIHKII